MSTYLHPAGNSQIDYMVTRQHVADAIGKRSGPSNIDLAGWRGCGQRPLEALLRAF